VFTDHYQLFAEVNERISVIKREMQMFIMSVFYFK